MKIELSQTLFMAVIEQVLIFWALPRFVLSFGKQYRRGAINFQIMNVP